MPYTLVAFAAGTGLLQLQAQLPALWAIACLLVSSLCLACFTAALPPALPATWLRLPLSCSAALAIGFACAALRADLRLQDHLPAELEGQDLLVTGVVASLPDPFAQGVRFHLAVEQASLAGGAAVTLPPRISLAWYQNAGAAEAVEVKPGARWQLMVRLQRPHGNVNPFGFDYEAWLLEQGVRATGYVRVSSSNRERDAFVPGFGAMVERARAALRSRIQLALPDAPYAGVIVALVVGEQRGVPQEQWQLFNRTGIGHLVSISGLHITMLAGLAAGLASFFWRRSFFIKGAALPLRLPAQKAAALAGLATAFLYVLLAGFGVPAQRTLYMIAVVALALWSGRITMVFNVLCIALIAVCLLDPWAVLWPGFWLSFGAVATMMYAGAGRVRPLQAPTGRLQKSLQGLREAARLQYVLTIGLVPLSLLLFGQLSLVSPLANALAIPLVSFLVTPLALAGSVLPGLPGETCLLAAHGLFAWLALLLEWLAGLPAAVWRTPQPALWMFLLALPGLLWLLAPRGWPARWLGLLLWLPMSLNTPAHPAQGQMWVTAFDVGQGMALLVETARHRLLYDAGPVYSPEADAGGRVLLPYLRARGISELDGLIVSHLDADHSGGALSVLREMPPAWLSTSIEQSHALVQAAPRRQSCIAGQRWEWDGVRFGLLHPAAASYAKQGLSTNARSCVLRIEAGGHVMLLAGDIEAAQEAELLARDPAMLRADVLLAPHHGSGTSSTDAFLDAVQPQLALFQVGHRNRYRHPKAEVWERYGEHGIRRLRTDRSGALALEFGTGITLVEERRRSSRYWNLAQGR